MTPHQTAKVAELRQRGFTVIEKSCGVIRVAKGADRRAVLLDGTEARWTKKEPRHA